LALCPGLSPASGCDRHFEGAGKPCTALPRNDAGLGDAERTLVIRTLERTGWNVSRSAKILGLTRDMMRYRIDKMGLCRPDTLDSMPESCPACTLTGLPDAAS
ncbi:MAG TPA: helix-turn-helix domain-containing protein, partial [Ramlibacter sp.]|nr:helix-turn-helix domain-containing protein [Ramlibacter sp.]